MVRHKLVPKYKAVSKNPPTPLDEKASDSLRSYLQEHSPQEDDERRDHRIRVLANVKKLVQDWVYGVCIEKGIPESVAKQAGGKLFVSGSYRLGVNEAGSDCDVVCVVPRFVGRDDFFTSLLSLLESRDDVEDLLSIPTAAVPVIEMKFSDIKIDLLLAQLPVSGIPNDLDILDDDVLKGVDMSTEKSLNGPRVTNLIVKLVPNYDTFCVALRAVRYWARKRSVYSNKMGFLGGVNWALLVAFVCQCFPTAAPSRLLRNFFVLLSEWRWPTPIRLCDQYEDPEIGLKVFNEVTETSSMPIITPAYPAMNSSYNVNSRTLDVLWYEFDRGRVKTNEILKEGDEEIDWSPLFTPFPFLAEFPKYLSLESWAPDEKQAMAWSGYVESRVRKLVERLQNLPFVRLRPYTQKYSNTARACSTVILIGVEVEPNVRQVKWSWPVEKFCHSLRSWSQFREGMQTEVRLLSHDQLPDFVWEDEKHKSEVLALREEITESQKKRLEEWTSSRSNMVWERASAGDAAKEKTKEEPTTEPTEKGVEDEKAVEEDTPAEPPAPATVAKTKKEIEQPTVIVAMKAVEPSLAATRSPTKKHGPPALPGPSPPRKKPRLETPKASPTPSPTPSQQGDAIKPVEKPAKLGRRKPLPVRGKKGASKRRTFKKSKGAGVMKVNLL